MWFFDSKKGMNILLFTDKGFFKIVISTNNIEVIEYKEGGGFIQNYSFKGVKDSESNSGDVKNYTDIIEGDILQIENVTSKEIVEIKIIEMYMRKDNITL